MRIISKFHDYYDGAMSLGQDQSLIYKREEVEVPVTSKHNSITWGMNETSVFSGIGFKRIIIGFCGKTYLCYHLIYKRSYMPVVEGYCYNSDQILTFLKLHATEDDIAKFQSKEIQKSRYSWWHRKEEHLMRSDFTYDGVQNVFDTINKRDLSAYFIENKIPCFAISYIIPSPMVKHKMVITHNSILRKYEFYKVMDAFTVYQELSMYISGVLGVGEPHMISISDVDMRDSKGFDEWSFKTMPGLKPNRKFKK